MQGETTSEGVINRLLALGLGIDEPLGTDALLTLPGHHDELKVKELVHLSLYVN